jgi:hypothetical protein
VHGKGATLKALGHGEQRSDLCAVYLSSKKWFPSYKLLINILT